MTAVTIQSDLGAQENKNCHYFHFSPPICCEEMRPDRTAYLSGREGIVEIASRFALPSFNKYVLSTYYVLDSILCTRYTAL